MLLPLLIPQLAQQHLVDGLNASSALADVLTYIIDIIKEVAEGIQHLVGLSAIFGSIGIGDDVDAQMLDVHVDIRSRHDGVAVIVDGPGVVAVYVQALRTEGLDL